MKKKTLIKVWRRSVNFFLVLTLVVSLSFPYQLAYAEESDQQNPAPEQQIEQTAEDPLVAPAEENDSAENVSNVEDLPPQDETAPDGQGTPLQVVDENYLIADSNPADSTAETVEIQIDPESDTVIEESVQDIIVSEESASILEAENTLQTDSDVPPPEILEFIPEGEAAAENINTGAESENTSETNVNNETNITNNNNAVTNNNAFLRADTGKNNANYNTGSGIISTQEARGRGEMVNVINKNSVNTQNSGPETAVAGNENTGPYSENYAETNINNQLTIRNINSSNTANVVEADVNSGQNSASNNTSHGIILTGDANLGLNFVSFANTNLINNNSLYANWQNVYGNYAENVDLANAPSGSSHLSDLLVEVFNRNTGEGSTNQAIVNVNDQTEIINQNSGILRNQVTADVVSGKNRANNNSGTGSATTGDVNSSVNMLNFLNTNVSASNVWIKNLNVFGTWTGNLTLPYMPAPNLSLGSQTGVTSENAITGEDSNNEAEVNIENSLVINNQNEAVVRNNVHMRTDTGNNLASNNTNSGVIKFGEANAQTNELNVTNLNVTGDSWWMVVVNKFGGWSGTVLGAAENAQVSGSPVTTIITPQNSGIVVENSPTGPQSNNIAGANINHGVEVSSENDALIENNIVVNNITGENETQYNTGHGYIETGNIKSSVNLVNFANANINVGNWMVVVINVFGDWNGNLVFRTAGVPQDTELQVEGSESSDTSSNVNTGYDSENSSQTDSDNQTNITNNNNSTTDNNTSANSISGENEASYNTGSGIISTGGADAGSSTANQTNSNNVNVGDNGESGTNSQNNGTGAGSDNNSSASSGNTTDIVNDNNSNTSNDISGNNVTGQNSSNYQTGDSLIDTGWANTYLGVYNETNEEDLTVGDLQENIDVVDPGENDENIPDDPIIDNGGSNSDNGSNNGNNSGNNNSGSGGGGGSPITILAGGPRKKLGDLNGDGRVDDMDFSILMANWAKPLNDRRADANEDSKVNELDFSIVMFNWDKMLASKTVNKV